MRAAGIEVVGAEAHSSRARARIRRAAPGLPAFGLSRRLPDVDAILVAVPDSAIAECAAALASRLGDRAPVVLHTSGLVTSRALAPLKDVGCSTGSMHPLVTFPSATGAPAPLAGAAAAVEGQPEAVLYARRLARALGMRPFPLRARAKPLYHAAAALGANMAHVLLAVARTLLIEVGLPEPLARRGLAALARGNLEAALSARGLEHLTGPLARADGRAVRADLLALPRRERRAYQAVASLAIAEMRHQSLINGEQARRLIAALTGPS
jgi:predicted short-subunit dehydrogenase-like oxidoreductase (DUF2520 family)